MFEEVISNITFISHYTSDLFSKYVTERPNQSEARCRLRMRYTNVYAFKQEYVNTLISTHLYFKNSRFIQRKIIAQKKKQHADIGWDVGYYIYVCEKILFPIFVPYIHIYILYLCAVPFSM